MPRQPIPLFVNVDTIAIAEKSIIHIDDIKLAVFVWLVSIILTRDILKDVSEDEFIEAQDALLIFHWEKDSRSSIFTQHLCHLERELTPFFFLEGTIGTSQSKTMKWFQMVPLASFEVNRRTGIRYVVMYWNNKPFRMHLMPSSCAIKWKEKRSDKLSLGYNIRGKMTWI